MKNIVLYVENRQYARHIYSNFKKTYTSFKFQTLLGGQGVQQVHWKGFAYIRWNKLRE